MQTILVNGNDAAAMVAQLLTEHVYAVQCNRFLETNIWNQPVQLVHNVPLSSLLTVTQSTSVLIDSLSLLSAIPRLYKLVTEKSPTVIHVAAQHNASFADFTHVMAVRDTGMTLVCSSSVQEIYDLGIIAHYVSLATSIPVLHFYDSRRLAEETSTVQLIDQATLVSIFSTVKEAVTTDVYSAFSEAVERVAEHTGRSYASYVGHPETDDYVIAAMGASANVIAQTLKGVVDKVGVLNIRLYRPWTRHTLPTNVKRIAVLEPTHERPWNPLFLDIATTYDPVDVVGGHYTNMTPSAVMAVVEGLRNNTLDRTFLVSNLPTITTDAPRTADIHELLFVNSEPLARAFATHYTHAQLFTTEEGVTHVRVSTHLRCSFLPSLIQEADTVVLPATTHQHLSATTALNRLKTGGRLAVEQALESLTPILKTLAYTKQARLVQGITDIHRLETIPVPDHWQHKSATVNNNELSTSLPPPPQQQQQQSSVAPYIQLLEQIFGDRLSVASDHHTPDFGYGRLISRLHDRARFKHATKAAIQTGQLPPTTLRTLSHWINARHTDTITQAADRVMQTIPAMRAHKHMLYPASHWLAIDTTTTETLDVVHNVLSSHNDAINLLLIVHHVEGGRRTKDVGLYAMQFGSAYVASVAQYDNGGIVHQVLVEADAFQGPSVVLVTTSSPTNPDWPCYRWNPNNTQTPFQLDSGSIQQKQPLADFLARENKFSQLVAIHPDLSILSTSLESEIQQRHEQGKAKARADYARLLAGLSQNNGPPLTVLFGSDNGNAEKLAKTIAKQAQDRGCKVKQVMAMDDGIISSDGWLAADRLDDEHVVIVVCSTAGQGEMPRNARGFWKALRGLMGGRALANVHFAVFGLGDSHYWPHDDGFYNRPGKLLDAKLDSLGATRLVPLGLGDDQDEDGFQTAFDAWLPKLFQALGVHSSSSSSTTYNEVQVVYTDDQIKKDSNYLRGDIAQELADYATGSVSETTAKLLTFHGAYLQQQQQQQQAYSFMIRVRTPGGVVTPKQWLVMDSLATKYGNKTLKLTTRQTFQIHGVLKKNLRTTIRHVNKSLLTTLGACGDVCRNIMCTTTGGGNVLVRNQLKTLVVALTELLAPQTSAYHELWLDNSMVAGHAVQDNEPIYGPTYLPRKFKIGIAVPPSNDVDVYAHDLGLVAIVENNVVVGYNVLVGGGMGHTHGNKATYPRSASLIGYVAAADIVELVKAVVLVHRDHGDRTRRRHRARFKYTVDRLGLDRIKQEIETRSSKVVVLEDARPFTFENNTDTYGWWTQDEGNDTSWHYTLFIENGRVKDLTGLRELAKFHKGEFRLTPNQNLVIANVPQQDVEKIKAILEKYNMVDQWSGIRKSSMACVALPTCGLALAESERYLPNLITLLETVMDEAGLREDAIVTRMTGCSNGCARPYLAELAFVGKAPDTYDVYLGGSRKGERLNKLHKENIKEDDIMKELSPMIKRYALERHENESFGDWVIKAGYM